VLAVPNLARRALRFLEPYGIFYRREARARARDRAEQRARYEVAKAAITHTTEPIHDYDQLMVLAIEAGADAERVRAASISVESLHFILDRIAGDRIAGNRAGGPGLHIGNYAGVSLAYLTAHTDGLVVAIDPNAIRWGSTRGQDVVVRLLDAAGVDDRVLLLCGYSLQRNAGVNGRVIDANDPTGEFSTEPAPDHVLRNLHALGIEFAWMLVDGHHDGAYVQAELEQLEPLLRDGGVVFLDDCSEHYPEILALFERPGSRWRADGYDGRIGVLRRTSDQSQPQAVP
jgi:hypothetical protein